MRIHLLAKWSAPSLLIFHIISRALNPEPSIGKDLLLYNAVALVAVALLFQAPLNNDPLAVAFAALAIISWAIGSILSTLLEFNLISEISFLVPNIAYLLFYPFAFLAIPRVIGKRPKLALIEILDAAIFGLGLSSIIASLLLGLLTNESPDNFFSVLYPICDIALIAIVLAGAVISRFSIRLTILVSGIIAFALTDLYFLWCQLEGRYEFGQLSDEGWLIGIVLFALSFWFIPQNTLGDSQIHPALVAVSIFISPALLSAMAIRPEYFPSYVVIPTISTLFLAFIRTVFVVRQANNLGEEKLLARTDELTGLPNRRRLIAELSAFSNVEGALMLLDLDGFKPVNDKYGHEMGDQILRQVAQRFSRSLPSGAILARLGGDEFGVLVSGNSESTLEIAAALKATLSYPFTIDGSAISIGVSIGHVRNDGTDDLLQRADLAMYEAKRANAELQAYRP